MKISWEFYKVLGRLDCTAQICIGILCVVLVRVLPRDDIRSTRRSFDLRRSLFDEVTSPALQSSYSAPNGA